jgi:hypothetical protein
MLNESRLKGGLVLGVLSGACAGAHVPVTYAGRSEPVIARAQDLREAPALPAGYDQLGELRARCALTPGFRAIDDEPLSDVDCSERRLTRAMLEAAAEAGADLLVDRRCASREYRDGRLEIVCRAGAARPTAQHPAVRAQALPASELPSLPAPGPAEVERIDEPSVSATSGVRVRFTPRVKKFAFPARRADLVGELATLPVSHRALGDLVTRCERTCSPQDLRLALYAAAGRLGATDVVDVRCFTEGSGSACVATAAAPERDPQADSVAR